MYKSRVDSFLGGIVLTHLSSTCHYLLHLMCLPPQLLGYCRSFDIILPVRQMIFKKLK